MATPVRFWSATGNRLPRFMKPSGSMPAAARWWPTMRNTIWTGCSGRNGPGWGSHPSAAPGFARCGWRSGSSIRCPPGTASCKPCASITACRNAARTRRWAMSARWPIFSRRCCARSRSSAGWRRGSSLRPMPPRNGIRRASPSGSTRAGPSRRRAPTPGCAAGWTVWRNPPTRAPRGWGAGICAAWRKRWNLPYLSPGRVVAKSLPE